MILDTLINHPHYTAAFPASEAAFAWIESCPPDHPDGRYEIDGDRVFALVQSYSTTPSSNKRFEAHRRYLDIQTLLDGTEIISHAPITRLQPATDYDSAKDFQLYHDSPAPNALRLEPGDFALFLPQDGHKPGCLDQAVQAVRKIVIKIQL